MKMQNYQQKKLTIYEKYNIINKKEKLMTIKYNYINEGGGLV